MDFVKRYSPNEEYTQAHEQYRGFVIFQRTQAAAAQQAENEKPEAAIDEVRRGLEELKAFFNAHGLLEQMDDDGMVQHLRKIEERLREEYGITSTLREELDAAVAAEDYERAAQLRDELKLMPRDDFTVWHAHGFAWACGEASSFDVLRRTSRFWPACPRKAVGMPHP